MNEKFFSLPKEKQDRIINAALSVFAQNGYKHGSTDDIAAQAGISKGLLFHYFQNKKELYGYLYEYSIRVTGSLMKQRDVFATDDFFDMCIASSHAKTEIMKEYPYVYDFVLGAYYNRDIPAVSRTTQATTDDGMQAVLALIDRTKFKDGVDVETVLRLVVSYAEGLMYSCQREGAQHDLDRLCSQFDATMELLRAAFYKEEFL